MRVYITVEACDLDSESGGAQQYVRGAGGAIAVRQTPEHEHVGASREAGDPGVNVYLRAREVHGFQYRKPPQFIHTHGRRALDNGHKDQLRRIDRLMTVVEARQSSRLG